jgi:acetyl-CoA acyltransferase
MATKKGRTNPRIKQPVAQPTEDPGELAEQTEVSGSSSTAAVAEDAAPAGPQTEPQGAPRAEIKEDRIAVVAGARTPFARAWGVFKDWNEADLGRAAVSALLNKADIDPKLIDQVIMGCVSAPMNGPNVAREIVLRSELDNDTAAYTVQLYCASSGQAVINGMGEILMGNAEIVIAGGVESMSAAQARLTLKLTHALNDASKAKTLQDRLRALSGISPKDLLPEVPSIAEPTTGKSMGETAEEMAKDYQIGRREQDELAAMSHQRAAAAYEAGWFGEVITVLAGKRYDKVVDRDTDVRSDTSVEKMAKLKPVFDKKYGSVTAANASPLTDGASAVLLMRESKARELGLRPIAYIRASAVTGLDLTRHAMLLGPTFATHKLFKRAGLGLADLDLVEMHEAFAAQVLTNLKVWGSDALSKKLGLSGALGEVDMTRFNIQGGSIAIGHPFGATGARLVMQLAGELERLDKNLGLLTICAAGGLGLSMVLER